MKVFFPNTAAIWYLTGLPDKLSAESTGTIFLLLLCVVIYFLCNSYAKL